MRILPFAALLFLLVSVSEAEKFQRCELIRTMRKFKLDQYYTLENWICMAYYGSKFNSGAVSDSRSNSGQNYGIFQINSRWWCSNGNGKTANGCRILCSKLMDDDLKDDILCAKRIVRNRKRGMNAWVAWRKYCKRRDLSHWTKGC